MTGLSAIVTLDRRSLALCRIATGLLILGDLLSRVQWFRLHYTDEGILPRQLLFEGMPLRFPCLHAASGWEPYLAVLFAVHALAAVSLSLGYRTRLSGFLAWYLTVSLQERIYLVNNGGDKVLASLLFWAMFLPWGETLSVDAQSKEGPPEPSVSSMATAVLLFQPIMIYWVSVFHKLEPTWLRGEVLLYSFQLDLYARPFAHELLAYPLLLKGLAYLTLLWELVGPVLLLSTRPRVRTVACLAFIGMHFGFGVFLRLGVFQFSPMLYMLAFFPAAAWNWGPLCRTADGWSRLCAMLGRRLRPAVEPPVLIGRKTEFALACLFVYVFVIALGQDSRLRDRFPLWAQTPAHLLGLHQRWTVFVDVANLTDGWVAVEARTTDGRTIDLWSGDRPPVESKPPHPFRRFNSFRWPTPLVVIVGDARLHKPFVRALSLHWQREHPQDQIEWARLVFYRERHRTDGRPVPAERDRLWEGSPWS